MIPFRPVASTLAPLIGAAFAILWIAAEANRSGLPGVATLAVAFGAAIGLSVWMPAAALGISILVPGLQLVSLAPATSATTWPMYLAICIVTAIIAATGDRRMRLLALPITLLATGFAAVHMTFPTDEKPEAWTGWVGVSAGPQLLGNALTLLSLAGVGAIALCWAIGFGIGAAVRLRRLNEVLIQATDRLAETDFELRLGIERSRISRDVHDSVAHALTIVVAQSEGAAAMSSRQPEVTSVALSAISGVARDALADVRGLIERITDAGDELLSLADLPALVDRMSGVGMHITLDEWGARPTLRPTHQLTVYRIVQESLTNALKHGGTAGRAAVVLDWRGPGLALMVRSSGSAPLVERGSVSGSGAGIDGMQERARIIGGWLTAEPSDADEFVVTAYLPLRTSETPSPINPAARAATTVAATPENGGAVHG